MSQEIRANYDQIDLLPQGLEDGVSADDPARFMREFVEALALAELGFAQRESEEGRPNYAADLLLQAWWYGYLARIRSTRELERACREPLSLVGLTGRHAPDHNPRWRFWRENRAALRQGFRAGVKVAAEPGLVGLICPAVDGTKIRGASSPQGVHHRPPLERAWGRGEASIRAMEQAVEEAEGREEGDSRLPEGRPEAQKLRQALRTSLARRQAVKRDPLPPREPEARRMLCEGGKEIASHAPGAVDGASQRIVADDVVNEESDNRRRVPMLDEGKANVGEVAEATVADGGYKSSVGLGEAEQKGYGGVVKWGGEASGKRPGPSHKSRFHHPADEDVVIGPRGERREFEAVKTHRWKRFAVRGYRGRSFQPGPGREEGSHNRQGRWVEISPYDAAVAKQRAPQHDPQKQKLLKQRKIIGEPIFGVIKQDWGFRRWTGRGLENVRTQGARLCAALTLRRRHRAWAAGKLALA